MGETKFPVPSRVQHVPPSGKCQSFCHNYSHEAIGPITPSGTSNTRGQGPRTSSGKESTSHTLGQRPRSPSENKSTSCTLGQQQGTPSKNKSTQHTLGQQPGMTSGNNSTTHAICHQSPITLARQGVKRKAPLLPLTNLWKKVRLSPPYKKRLRTRGNTTTRENATSVFRFTATAALHCGHTFVGGILTANSQ